MRLLLTILASIFFGGLVFTKFNRLWRQRTESAGGQLAATIWLVTLLLGTSMTLHVDPIQAAIGSFSGFNNVGWYLAYMIGVPGFYLIGSMGASTYTYGVRANGFRRGLRVILVICWVYFTWIYFGWLRHIPEWLPRSPRDWQTMLFLVGFFGYAGIATAFSLFPLWEALNRQSEPLMRIRTALGLGMALLASICFLFKTAYAVLGYLFPDWAFVEIINQIALLAMAGVAVALVPLLVSHRTYLRIYDFFSLWYKLRQLEDLKYLQRRLQAYCPSVIWQEPTWWEKVRRPDFYIYRTMVSILDSERILAGNLDRLDRSRMVTIFVADHMGTMRYWDPGSVQEARQLHQQIHIPQDASYTQLLLYLHQLGRTLRQS